VRRIATRRKQFAVADPVFVRLAQELMLTYRVERKIERGLVGHEHIEEVRELERDTWNALVGLCRGTSVC
jgi:hypothetical protein